MCQLIMMWPPGRWELPDNTTGLTDFGDMLNRMDDCSGKLATYGALQGVIIIVLIFRMLHLWNFQSQVCICHEAVMLRLLLQPTRLFLQCLPVMPLSLSKH